MEKHTSEHIEERNHQCWICDKSFKKRDHLKAHIKVHTGERPYKCRECGSAFTRSSHLKSHILIHTGEKPHRCQICDKKFTEAGNLKKHMVTHTGEQSHQCTECKLFFRTVGSLKKHFLIHNGVRPDESEQLTDSHKLNEHLVTHKSDDNNLDKNVLISTCISTPSSELSYENQLGEITCTKKNQLVIVEVPEFTEYEHNQHLMFNKTFIHMGYLKKHSKEQIGSRSYSCSECNRAFTEKRYLKTHILIHTGEKPHECRVCKKRFRDRGNLRKHLAVHTRKQPYTCLGLHKNLTVSNCVEELHSTNTAKQVNQDQPCGNTFTNEMQLQYFGEDLEKHIATQIGPRPEVVSDCYKNNISTSLVEQQLDRENQIFEETVVCESQLGSDKLILYNEQTYLCSLCGKNLKGGYNFKRHMRGHSGQRPFQCRECDSTFSRNSHLKTHLLIHSGEKPNECHVCKKRFRDLVNLRRHMAVHTGKQPYQYPGPNKNLKVSNSIEKLKSTYTAKQVYQDQPCGNTFTQEMQLNNFREDLDKHIATEIGPGPEVVLSVSDCSKNISTPLIEHQLDRENQIFEETVVRESQLGSDKLIHYNERTYLCLLCHKNLKGRSNFKRHVRGHSGQRPFQCRECNSTFSRSSHLKTHLLIHSGEKPNVCRVCERRFRNPSNLRKHMVIHSRKWNYQNQGRKENVSISNCVRLLIAIPMSKSCGKMASHCSLLKRDLNSKSLMKRTVTHKSKRPCQRSEVKTDSTILNRVAIQPALSTADPSQPFEKTFTQEIQLKSPVSAGNLNRNIVTHIASLTADQSRQVQPCDNPLTQDTRLKNCAEPKKCKKHIVTKISKQASNSSVLDEVLPMSDCSKPNMSTHVPERLHSEDIVLVKTDTRKSKLGSDEVIAGKERNYQCSFCKIGFNHKGNFNRHIKLHKGERPYRCPECDSAFSRNSHLKTHILIHTGERPHECRVCKKRFRDPGNFKKHLVAHTRKRLCQYLELKKNVKMPNHVETHSATLTADQSHIVQPFEKTSRQEIQITKNTESKKLKNHIVPQINKRTYECRGPKTVLTMSDCSKTNTSRSVVKQLYSEDVIHEKLTTCESQLGNEVIAGKERNLNSLREINFMPEWNLKPRMKLHRVERPYQCPGCSSAFKNKSHLKVHILIHTGEKPHECPVCKKRFRDPGNFKKHGKIHSKKQPYQHPELKNKEESNCVEIHSVTHTGKQLHRDPPCGDTFTRDVELKSSSGSRILKKHIVKYVSKRPDRFKPRN